MTWQEYLEDASKASNILEVLTEKPNTNSRRKSSAAQPTLYYPLRVSAKNPVSPYKDIERIRIRSVHIINGLQAITEQTFASSSRLIIHRPFKVLLFYHEQIVEYLAELEYDFTENTRCALGNQCKGYIELDGINLGWASPRRSRTYSNPRGWFNDTAHYPEGSHPTISYQGHCRHEISEELLAQAEAITHLRILVKFMKEDMKEIFIRHELLRFCSAERIAFQDMWHLFMAGDLVVAESEPTERGLELYQISILRTCDFFSSRRPVKQIQTRSEGSHQFVESIYKEEAASTMSVFTIDAFYFDFDGQNFGPVEKGISLISLCTLFASIKTPIVTRQSC